MKPIGHNDEITPGDWHRTRINELKAIEIEAALSVPINGNSNATNGPQDDFWNMGVIVKVYIGKRMRSFSETLR